MKFNTFCRKRLSSEFDSPKNHNKQTRLHEKPSRANLFNNSDSRKVTALRSSVDLEEEERRSQSVNLPFSSPPLFSLPSPSITPSSYSEVFMRLRSTSAPISVVKRGGIGGSGGGGGGEDEDEEEGGGKTKRWSGAPPLSGRLPSPLPHVRKTSSLLSLHPSLHLMSSTPDAVYVCAPRGLHGEVPRHRPCTLSKIRRSPQFAREGSYQLYTSSMSPSSFHYLLLRLHRFSSSHFSLLSSSFCLSPPSFLLSLPLFS